jgi:hypothetical protein
MMSNLDTVFQLNRQHHLRAVGRVRYVLLVDATEEERKLLTSGILVGDRATPVVFRQITTNPNVFFSTTTYNPQPIAEQLARIFRHDNFMLCTDCFSAQFALHGAPRVIVR